MQSCAASQGSSSAACSARWCCVSVEAPLPRQCPVGSEASAVRCRVKSPLPLGPRQCPGWPRGKVLSERWWLGAARVGGTWGGHTAGVPIPCVTGRSQGPVGKGSGQLVCSSSAETSLAGCGSCCGVEGSRRHRRLGGLWVGSVLSSAVTPGRSEQVPRLGGGMWSAQCGAPAPLVARVV